MQFQPVLSEIIIQNGSIVKVRPHLTVKILTYTHFNGQGVLLAMLTITRPIHVTACQI